MSDEAVIEITKGIQNTLDETVIELGTPEATKIKADTGAFEGVVTGSTSTLKKANSEFIAQVKEQVGAWQKKEGQTSSQIEQKKQELLQHGIRLDMPFIPWSTTVSITFIDVDQREPGTADCRST